MSFLEKSPVFTGAPAAPEKDEDEEPPNIQDTGGFPPICCFPPAPAPVLRPPNVPAVPAMLAAEGVGSEEATLY